MTEQPRNARTLALIGCYTSRSGGPRGNGRGLVLAELGTDGRPCSVLDEVEADSPSYAAWSADGRLAHAVHETSPGRVSSYRVDLDPPRLTRGSTQPSHGDRPCHLTVQPSGELVVSNYAGGPCAVLAQGSSWWAPGIHPHHALVTDGLMVTCDLGRDEVTLYDVAVPASPLLRQVLAMPGGSGPRHAALLDENHLAVVGEHDATVSVVRFGRDSLVRLSTVPSTGRGPHAWPSELAVAHTDEGPVLVVGHRRPGHLSIHRIVDGVAGPVLERVTEHDLPSDNARHLVVDRTTAVVWVALQDADSVVAVDLLDGRVRGRLTVGSPSCVALRPEAAPVAR